MMTDEAVKAYVLDGVKFSNAHATWFKALDSSEQKAFKAKMAADRAARRVESPIMTRAKLEDAYKAQTKQFEQVQKHFPALVQLSVEDNEEIFYEVERGVIAGNDVHEVNGACGSGYRACQRDCNRVFSCLDACYIGYLACLQASNPVLP